LTSIAAAVHRRGVRFECEFHVSHIVFLGRLSFAMLIALF
jgi:hypothetical protein